MKKKNIHCGSIFFGKAIFSGLGLTNYVIRHNSKNGNNDDTSSTFKLLALTSLTNKR